LGPSNWRIWPEKHKGKGMLNTRMCGHRSGIKKNIISKMFVVV